MQRRTRNAVLAAVACGGVLTLTNTLGCEAFFADTALTAVDFCFIFDCQNGILGGTLQPCSQALDDEGNPTGPGFVDCPAPIAP